MRRKESDREAPESSIKNRAYSRKKSLEDSPDAPKLARRRQNKYSAIKLGRTIGERRERLETANERLAARKKVKKRQNLRVIITIVSFAAVLVAIVIFAVRFFKQREMDAATENTATPTLVKSYQPTIEVIDENHAGNITSRMLEYIGQVEADFKEKGLTPVRAVIPVGAIREVDFYLDSYPGFIKTTIDRGSGITVEDAERMLRYLSSINVDTFTYIDVRIDGKAYWK